MFSNNETKDYFTIMALIDSFAESNNAKISLNDQQLFHIIKRMYKDFPCKGGIDKANVFKKSSVFLCEFIGNQIIESFECKMSEELKNIPNNSSAIIGFYIVTTMLKGATVQNGEKTIENNIELSSHSYIDIIDALRGVSLSTGFRLVSVLLEQLVYKSNPVLQYHTQEV